jgi:methionyl-tRNA formyltransferase
MFRTVVLLAEREEQIALAPILTRHNPALTIKPVATLGQVQSRERTLLKQARLVAFTTTTVVPADVLYAIGYGAYNFHPGPSTYPGWAPAHFAIYEEASHFGATPSLDDRTGGLWFNLRLRPVPHACRCWGSRA